MATECSWDTPDEAVTVIGSTGSGGDGGGADLLSLAANGFVIASLITPVNPRPIYASYEMKAKVAAATSMAGATLLRCWYLDRTDGTNVISNTGVVPPTEAPDFVIFWPNVAAVGGYYLRSSPRFILRPPWAYKMLIQNASPQATTAVASDNILSEVTFNELGT